MRGTRQRERRLRKFVFFIGLVTLAFSVMVWLMMARSEPDAWKVTTGIGSAGALLILMSVVARPIPKVTWRAWLAGRWHGRHARRAAVNESGYKSARAKRSATNKAAWAAQRARDGRAAAAPYPGKSENLKDEQCTGRQQRALEGTGWA
jgi:hypothetical protein